MTDFKENTVQVISFTGKKGHGKSTACEKLVEMFGDRVVRLNFKDALIQTMKEKLPEVLKDLEMHYMLSVEQLFQEKPAIMRKLMQFVGTDIYREIDPNYWVNHWKKSVMAYEGTDKIIVCDDVRFKNEFDAVSELGGSVTRLVASNKPLSHDTHPSETEMDTFVCRTIWSWSADELRDEVEKLFKEQ